MIGDPARVLSSTSTAAATSFAAPDVIIVGAGLMGRWHCRTAHKLGARVIGIVDRDLEAARALTRDAPGAMATASVELALADEAPSVAHVCTPTAAHFDAALALVEAGVHVLVEKPLCQSAAQAERLIAAAAPSSVILCPVHQYAFQNGVARAEAWLRELGTMRRIQFDIRSAGADGASAERRAAVIDEILPHPISILQRLLPGAPLAELDWRVTRSGDGEYSAHAATSDVAISISISLNARPTCFRTSVLADGGAIDIDGFHGFATLARGGAASRASKLLGPFSQSLGTLTTASLNLARRALEREPAYPGLAALVRAFYRAAGSGGSQPAPISAHDTVANMQAWERLRGDSARTAP